MNKYLHLQQKMMMTIIIIMMKKNHIKRNRSFKRSVRLKLLINQKKAIP